MIGLANAPDSGFRGLSAPGHGKLEKHAPCGFSGFVDAFLIDHALGVGPHDDDGPV